MAKRRIAYARIAQESNCFSPVLTTVEDFRRTHWLEGEVLGEACSPRGVEARGFMKHGELTGFVDAMREAGNVEPVPLFSGWAIPSGPLDRDAFSELSGRLEQELRRARPLDGVLLCLHGAMGAIGVRDPDTELVRAARRGAGLGVPIAVTHDLHANLTRERVMESDVIVSYRTNPHRDHRRTGLVAGRSLLAMLNGKAQPTTAWRSLPILLGGGTTVDVLPPVRSIFQRLEAMHRDPRVLTASALMCHPWNDEPRLGWSTLVSTDGEQALADDLADELAERCWAVRHQQPPSFPGPREAIEQARAATIARRLGTVVLSDASDVVSAGAPGENTRLLAALLADATDMLSYVPLRDPEVVTALFDKPEGARVRVSVGGKLHPSGGTALEVLGRIQQKLVHHALGRMVALDLGHVKLVLTEGHAMAVKPEFYGDIGLSPWRADIVVVKNFFPFRIYFAPMARKVIYVRTEGVTDLDAAFRLKFDGPMWPRDAVREWRSTDARRRAPVAESSGGALAPELMR